MVLVRKRIGSDISSGATGEATCVGDGRRAWRLRGLPLFIGIAACQPLRYPVDVLLRNSDLPQHVTDDPQVARYDSVQRWYDADGFFGPVQALLVLHAFY